jgi:hypothetical protein
MTLREGGRHGLRTGTPSPPNPRLNMNEKRSHPPLRLNVMCLRLLLAIGVMTPLVVSCGASVKSQYDARVAACRGKQGEALVACYQTHPISDEPQECMEYRVDPWGDARWSPPITDEHRRNYAHFLSMRVNAADPDREVVEARSLACAADAVEQAKQQALRQEAAERKATAKAEAEAQLALTALRQRQLEEEKQRKATAYKETMDSCVRTLSTASCESQAHALDDDQKRTCPDDCKTSIAAVEEKLATDSLRGCLDAYVEGRGSKPTACKVQHRALGADNEELKRIAVACNVACKKEAPKALSDSRKAEARERAEGAQAERQQSGGSSWSTHCGCYLGCWRVTKSLQAIGGCLNTCNVPTDPSLRASVISNCR